MTFKSEAEKIITSIEETANEINPAKIIAQVKAEISALRADLAEAKAILIKFGPAITAMLALLPADSTIPADVTELITLLPTQAP